MAIKVTQKVYDRIIELKTKYGLTNVVIAERLGLNERTVRVFLRAHREGSVPYRPNKQKCTTKQ